MLIFFSALLVCVVSVYLLRSCSVQIGLVDHPGGRKQHDISTPTVGGLAMFLAVLVTIFFVADSLTNHVRLLVGCAGLLVALGVLDDRHGLRVSLRMLIQVFLVLIVILGGDGVITHLGSLLGGDPIQLGVLAIPFSVVAIVGSINALNMIDGADGMAGKMAGITMLGVTVIVGMVGAVDLLPLCLAILGSLLGFLFFNTQIFVRRAWVFMGDAGSMWLGLVLGWFMVQVTHRAPSLEPAIVLWLLGIPLIDTLVVVFRRVNSSRSPFEADRTHIHHLLENSGYTVKNAVLVLSLVQLMLVGMGVVFYLTCAPGWLVFWGFVTVLVLYFYRFKDC